MKKFFTFSTALLCATIATAQNPTITTIHQNNWEKIAQAPLDTARLMMFPRAISFDIPTGPGSAFTKKVLVNWQTNHDKVVANMTHGTMGSSNQGLPGTFTSPAPFHSVWPNDTDLMGVIRRNTDGKVLAIPFYWGAGTADPIPFRYRLSSDNGATWVTHNDGSITGFTAKGEVAGGFRFHRGIIQDADGTMYAPAHSQFKKPDGTFNEYRVILMKSTDGGKTWVYVSTVQAPNPASFGEAAIVRCKDNSLLCVMRSGTGSAPTPLKFRRSTDNGVTWGAAVANVPGLPTTDQGVDPMLEMLPNGVLALSYGNNIAGSNWVARDCYVAFSADGNGNSWTSRTRTFQSGTTPSPSTRNRSTGYTSIYPLRNYRFVQVSDRGDNRYYGANYPQPNPYSIWSKSLDMVLNYRNRIDLKTKYALDPTTVNTDLTYTDANHPAARVGGAFDGSTEYWSGAYKASNSGTYTIDLKENHLIGAIGIHLMRGRQQSATIQYASSAAPSTWNTIKTYTSVTHHATDYTNIATPVTARYIRVNLSSTVGMVGINELFVFSAAETFEDYAVNVAPVGYSAANGGFWSSDIGYGFESERALRLNDTDSSTETGNKELSKTGYAASATKTFDFKIQTTAFATNGCIQFRLVSGTTNVFRLAVFSNGSIKYYTSAWQNMGASTPVPLNTWKRIRVVANASTNTAAVYVDGVLIGNATKETAAASITSLNGFLFSSTGTAATGDGAFFDDVMLYNTPTSPLNLQTTGLEHKKLNMVPPATEITEAANTGDFKVTISPNPASTFVKIYVASPSKDKVDLRLLDISGREYKRLQYQPTGEHSSYEINTIGLTPGIYIIQVKQEGRTMSSKVIIEL